MVEMKHLRERTGWLKERAKRIGGSEIAAVVGLNPYMTNVDLWRIKTGREVPDDISDKPAVKYGSEAEKFLRELFKLDYPQYVVDYTENNLFVNPVYPFAHASLDGWMRDAEGRLGILEIKTSTIQSSVQKAKWDGRIPDNYYAQVCWYMGVVEADFAILKAHLRWAKEDVFEVTKHYFIERADVEDDIEFLLEKGAEFYGYILRDEEPPLVLPEI